MRSKEFNPVVSRIHIYPVKSLDGVSLKRAQVVDGGCLMHDREYAIIDANGNFVNGKANERIHMLRSAFDLENEIISLRHADDTTWNHFHLQKERSSIQKFLSEFFGMPVEFQQDKTGQFFDIPVISGITMLSKASLETVSGWFGNMNLEETRRRFRATIELDGVPPFWEDHLFAEEGLVIDFKVGDIQLKGISPRERCVVPSRNPETGEVLRSFQKSFATHRAAALPEWSMLEQYGHAYYLSVDCTIPVTETGKWINVGDELKIIGKQQLT